MVGVGVGENDRVELVDVIVGQSFADIVFAGVEVGVERIAAAVDENAEAFAAVFVPRGINKDGIALADINESDPEIFLDREKEP